MRLLLQHLSLAPHFCITQVEQGRECQSEEQERKRKIRVGEERRTDTEREKKKNKKVGERETTIN